MLNSVISFGITSWGGNVAGKDKRRINRIIKRAGDLVGTPQEDFDSIFKRRDMTKTKAIIADSTHPLHDEFENRRIKRSGRYRMPKIRTERFKGSFVPRAIMNINKIYQRP